MSCYLGVWSVLPMLIDIDLHKSWSFYLVVTSYEVQGPESITKNIVHLTTGKHNISEFQNASHTVLADVSVACKPWTTLTGIRPRSVCTDSIHWITGVEVDVGAFVDCRGMTENVVCWLAASKYCYFTNLRCKLISVILVASNFTSIKTTLK